MAAQASGASAEETKLDLALIPTGDDGGGGGGSSGSSSPRRELSVKVANLPTGKVGEELLRTTLRGFGKILSVEVKPTLGKSDIAFVEFAREEEMRAALDAAYQGGITIRARLFGGDDLDADLVLEVTRRRARLAQRRAQVTKEALSERERESRAAVCSCSLTRNRYQRMSMSCCKRCNWDLSGVDLSAAASVDIVAEALAEPANAHVVGLVLRGCKLDARGTERAAALLDGVGRGRLRRFDVSENHLLRGDRREGAVKPFLEEDYHVELCGITALCHSLRTCDTETLRELSVRFCALEFGEVRAIVYALLDHSGGEHVHGFELDAELNFIDEGGKEFFAAMWKQRGQLIFEKLLV